MSLSRNETPIANVDMQSMNKCLHVGIGKLVGHIQLTDGDPWPFGGTVCPTWPGPGCCDDAAALVISHNEFRHVGSPPVRS
jgi:hypothetical protein